MSEPTIGPTTEPRLCRCGRPAATDPDDVTMCAEHRALWDANAEHGDADLAYSILEPWVKATKPIGNPMLTRIMKEALSKVEEEVNRTLDEVERAEAALEE
jgi:hypothetical protein